MKAMLGAGWYLTHVTDRVVELRKDDATYRRLLGRDGYVRLRAEPGMDRKALIEKAVQMAKRNDEALSQRVATQLMPRRMGAWRQRQQQLASVFGTGEEPEVMGVRGV